MNFDKTLISVDVESTGVDPATDRISMILLSMMMMIRMMTT